LPITNKILHLEQTTQDALCALRHQPTTTAEKQKKLPAAWEFFWFLDVYHIYV